MGRSTGFIGLVIVVAIGGYLYTSQLKKVAAEGTPTTAISLTGVRNDLFAMANAQKRYLATHPAYASMEQLRSDGDIFVPTRDEFVYTIDADSSHFKITATYTGSDPKAPRRLWIDDSLKLNQE
jgi:hypothetical protein